MADNVPALASAIYTLLNASATVSVYNTLAPQGATPPYIIFQRQTGLDNYTFTSNGAETEYTVKAISNRIWPGEAVNIYDHAHSIMQDGAASASGYTLLRNQRDTTFEFRDNEGFWHVGGIYQVDVHAT